MTFEDDQPTMAMDSIDHELNSKLLNDLNGAKTTGSKEKMRESTSNKHNVTIADATSKSNSGLEQTTYIDDSELSTEYELM